MPIRPRNNGYQIDVFCSGKRVRYQFEGTKRDAVALEMEIRLSLMRDGSWSAPTSIPPSPTKATAGGLPRILRDALPRARASWKGTSTAKWSATAEQHVREALSILKVDDLELDSFGFEEIGLIVADYRAKGHAAATIHNKLACLSKVFRVARAEPKLTNNVPDFASWKPKNTVEADRVLSDEEEVKLIDWCRKSNNMDFLDLCIFGLDLGLHSTEALSLRTTSFQGLDGDEPLCLVLGTKTEYRSAALPMTSRAVAAAKRRIEAARERGTTRLFYRWGSSAAVCRTWNHFRDHMGLSADRFFTFKMLRHTCGTRLDEMEVNAIKIRDFMRHGDLKTTSRYIHGSRKRLKHLADGLGMRAKEVLV